MNVWSDARYRIGRPHGVAIALVTAVVFGLGATSASARLAVKPANTSAPSISGSAQEGSTLTANPGNWAGPTPITFQYQWRRCGPLGAYCSDIIGQTGATYVLVSADDNNSVRVRVTASNSSGSNTAVSAPTAKISGPPTTTTTTTTTTTATTPATGCPSGSGTVDVAGITTPARLQINQFQAAPAVIPGTMSSFSLEVKVTDTCGQAVQGALVYATAVPFGQLTVPAEVATGADGSATLTFDRSGGFPATAHQQLLVFFVRARKPGDNILAGITTGRLISIPVRLH
jgi:hypothetical protein